MRRSGPDSRDPGLRIAAATVDAGGGPFSLPSVTMGVFLNDQPRHRIAIGADKRVERPLTSQQGWILPAGAAGLCEFDDDLSFVSVSLSPDLLSETGMDTRRDFAPVVGTLDPLLLQLTQTLQAAGAGAPRLYLESLHRAFAAQFLQAVGTELPAAEPDIGDRRIRRAIAHVRDRLADDITLEAMAGEAAMSPFHFARAFKKATGLSPLQFVIAERMKLAQVLLKTTALPVAEVAWRVGYGDVSRFGRHFKRATGATPAAFRV